MLTTLKVIEKLPKPMKAANYDKEEKYHKKYCTLTKKQIYIRIIHTQTNTNRPKPSNIQTNIHANTCTRSMNGPKLLYHHRHQFEYLFLQDLSSC
jgi:hypothetical protein